MLIVDTQDAYKDFCFCVPWQQNKLSFFMLCFLKCSITLVFQTEASTYPMKSTLMLTPASAADMAISWHMAYSSRLQLASRLGDKSASGLESLVISFRAHNVKVKALWINISTQQRHWMVSTLQSPYRHTVRVYKPVNKTEADVLQHRQERRRLHVGDPDLVLVLGKFSIEHGVEDGAADSKDILTEPKTDRQTDRKTFERDDGYLQSATFITPWLSYFIFSLPCDPELAVSHLEVRPQSGRQPSSHC